jgi:hypothetical protein
MLFRHLCASPALNLQLYADIDQFRESEQYARAESIPLVARDFSVMRATLSLPSCRLSLVSHGSPYYYGLRTIRAIDGRHSDETRRPRPG